jgi:multidrug efflux pump
VKLSDTAIRRPVLATVISILIVLFGAISIFRLSVRQYPDVDPPVVSVTTIYPGANPYVVETEVTEPLEEEINGIEGIRTLPSRASRSRPSPWSSPSTATWTSRPRTSATA